MRLPDNYLAVRVRKAWDGGALRNDQGQAVKGLGGQLLVEHTEGMHADEELLHKPGAVCIAEVVTPTQRFTSFPEVLTFGSDVFGSELFHEDEVLAGDVVAIKQNEFDLDAPLYTDDLGPVHTLPYSALLCIVRPGVLVPVGGYTLAEPTHPPGAEKDLVDGKIQLVVKKLGLVVEKNVQPLSGQGRLKYLGKALKGMAMPFYPGLRVLFNRWTSGPLYRIEGKDYFAVRHIDIAAVVGDDEEVLSLGESRYSRQIKRPVRQA